MTDDNDTYTSFLGSGWSFPPSFAGGGVKMSVDEVDIHESLQILFCTAAGERILQPDYGLDLHELMFEPVSTTLRAFLADRVRTAILVYEPRIKVVSLNIDSPDPGTGILRILLEYEVRATNSRFNLVFPFYRTDSNEVRASVAGAARQA
jgi:phage baseplate assembly protein W